MNSFFLSILGVGKAIWPYIAPILAKGAVSMLAIVLPVARQAVLTMWGQDLSGPEKRIAAIARVKEQLTREGIQISDSIISLAVELALQRIKAIEEAAAVEAANALSK